MNILVNPMHILELIHHQQVNEAGNLSFFVVSAAFGYGLKRVGTMKKN